MGNASSSASNKPPRALSSPEPAYPRDDPDEKGDHSESKFPEAVSCLPGQAPPSPTESGDYLLDSLPPYSLGRHRLQPVLLYDAMHGGSRRHSLASTTSAFSSCGGDNHDTTSVCSLNRSAWSRQKRLTSAEAQELNAAADALLKEIGDDVIGTKGEAMDSFDVDAILEEISSPPETPKQFFNKRPGTANPVKMPVTSLQVGVAKGKERHAIGEILELASSKSPLTQKDENPRREPKVPFDASKFRAANQVQRHSHFLSEVKEIGKIDNRIRNKENDDILFSSPRCFEEEEMEI